MANTTGEKELQRDWPNESGLTAETQKQEGRSVKLVAQEGSNVPERRQVLL